MNAFRQFENQMGGRWIGVRFHHQVPDNGVMAGQPMYFCEAVLAASTGSFTLTPSLLNCPGAHRSFGWQRNGDETLVEKLTSRGGFPAQIAKTLIRNTPRLDGAGIAAVTVGTYDAPDVLLSYVQPETAMQLVQKWQRSRKEDLAVTFSSVLAVCGHVAAAAHVTGRVCCSFGCGESRAHGSIGRDRLIIGVPARLVADLL